MGHDFRYVAWAEFYVAAHRLSHDIPSTVKCIIPIPRGGLVPATVLSHMLELPIILELAASERADILLIDDIADTGNTFAQWRKRYPNAKLAAPYVKPQGQPFVDYFVRQIPQNIWLTFPWEVSLGGGQALAGPFDPPQF